ncbi:hypothetical protein BKA83DRAFT_4181310, partial [Pisolithus microcarpus]
MSLYSLVGNKLHLQLQMRRLIHLHPPAPILTALVLLTSVPFLCTDPSTFIGGLPLWWRRLARWDLTLGRVATLFQALVHAVPTASLRIRINVCQESDTYRTPHEEARRRLYSGGTQVQAKLELGLRNPRSRYTPRLLPVYRDMRRGGNSKEVDAAFTISPKTYCKWHRMVFPDRVNLREILRISRLAPIGKAFRVDGDHERTKYKKLWQAYPDQRSTDLVVVFEQP